MTNDEIISMAREAGLSITPPRSGQYDGGRVGCDVVGLKRFADLAAAHEREKSLKLWMLLDDVDTADDIAKTEDAVYRSLCRQAHKKRWAVLNRDEVDAILARGNA